MSKLSISKLTIKGFKSFKELIDFHPRKLNVMIGPNGAGKSNFISFFRFLSWMLGTATGGLQEFVGNKGGASKLLHDGSKKLMRSRPILN